jgi:hypothetical protein
LPITPHPQSQDEESNSGTTIASSIKIPHSLNLMLAPELQEGVNRAVMRLLPEILHQILPGVEKAVEEVLPGALQEMLPSAIEDTLPNAIEDMLVSSAPWESSQSSQSTANQAAATTTSPPRPRSLLTALIRKRIRRDVQQIHTSTLTPLVETTVGTALDTALETIEADVTSHLAESTIKLTEEYEELRLDLTRTYDECVADLMHEGDAVLERVRDEVVEMEENCVERMEMTVAEAEDLFDPVIAQHEKKQSVRQLEGRLRRVNERLLDANAARTSSGGVGRGARAGSAPV